MGRLDGVDLPRPTPSALLPQHDRSAVKLAGGHPTSPGRRRRVRRVAPLAGPGGRRGGPTRRSRREPPTLAPDGVRPVEEGVGPGRVAHGEPPEADPLYGRWSQPAEPVVVAAVSAGGAVEPRCSPQARQEADGVEHLPLHHERSAVLGDPAGQPARPTGTSRSTTQLASTCAPAAGPGGRCASRTIRSTTWSPGSPLSR